MAQKPDKEKEAKHVAGIPAEVKRYIDIVRAQSDEDMKRHMSALIEHTDNRIAGISEQFVDFDRKLDSHAEMIGSLAEDVSTLTDNVATLTDNVATLTENVATLTGNVATLTDNVATLTEDMSIVKTDISEIKKDLKQKVDRDEFVALERRVSAIEVR